jgi:hypothetical protein
MAPVCASPISTIEMSQMASDLSGQCRCHWPITDTNPNLKMTRTGLDHHTRLMTIGAHCGQHRRLGVIQIDQNIPGILRVCVRSEINIKTLAVASAKKSQGGLIQNLRCRPEPLARERFSSLAMDQSDEVGPRRHGRDLTTNRPPGQRESSIEPQKNASYPPLASACGHGHILNGNHPFSRLEIVERSTVQSDRVSKSLPLQCRDPTQP